jgi:hypothetical protein
MGGRLAAYYRTLHFWQRGDSTYMCGIVGYTGEKNCFSVLMDGLTAHAYADMIPQTCRWEGSELPA